MDPPSDNDGTETAIEPPVVRRRRDDWLAGVMFWFLMFTSEAALYLYVIAHWLIACILQITFSEGKKHDDEGASFFSFINFISTLSAFLAIMSHVSGLLFPLFALCSTCALYLFLMINLSALDAPAAQELFFNICNHNNATMVLYNGMVESPTGTTIKTYLLILFYVITCAAIMFQVTRNEEHMRMMQQAPRAAGYYPHLIVREMPVGASNLDEPPRYSSLEPLPSPKTRSGASTVTSPPRYSYWERTFGRNRDRSTSQCSEQSNRVEDGMMTAKSR
uniref:Uncharacterized protein n=1 Tax=Caenorhabditis tropicalis TaxID=1561998 RepID=A0A1I7U8W6_9PELO